MSLINADNKKCHDIFIDLYSLIDGKLSGVDDKSIVPLKDVFKFLYNDMIVFDNDKKKEMLYEFYKEKFKEKIDN